MYSLAQIGKGVRNPHLLTTELHAWHDTFQRRVRGKSGVRVMDADWDNLLILDACRYDIFEEQYELDGTLRPVISRGSHTGQFLKNNFDDYHGDTVYVSAAPMFERHRMNPHFYADYQVWKDGWDEDHHTVLPETVVQAALTASQRHPDKRLVVHFVQPHYPFLTDQDAGLSSVGPSAGLVDDKPDEYDVWTQLRRREVDEADVWRAYRENLDAVLPHVERLVDELVGKTVVTSDHGNAFGEWGVYGHPARTFIESVVKVPWLTVPHSERRSVTWEERQRDAAGLDDRVEDRLRQMGYV